MTATTFADAGFLSDQHRSALPSIRKANEAWFSVLSDLSAILQQTAHQASQTVKGSPFEQKPFGLLVLHRANGLLQGAVMLLEHGMLVEAKTLTRSVLECAFVMAGLHAKPDEVKAMIMSDMDAAKKGQAKAILKTGAGTHTKALEDRIKEFGKVSPLKIDALADLGVLNKMYLNYRVLSNDAAHPSGKSLSRHMDQAPDGKTWSGYRVGGGSDTEIADAAEQLVLIGMVLGIAFQEMVGDTVNNERMGDIATRQEQIALATRKTP